MKKIAVGEVGRGRIHIDATPAENLRALALAKDCEVDDLTIVILDRPRHEELIARVREAGAWALTPPRRWSCDCPRARGRGAHQADQRR